MTKAVIRYNGLVLWQPPATYKDPTSKIALENPIQKTLKSKIALGNLFDNPWKKNNWIDRKKIPDNVPEKFKLSLIKSHLLMPLQIDFYRGFRLLHIEDFFLMFCWNVLCWAVWVHNRRWILSLRHPDLPSKAWELELRRGKGSNFGQKYLEVDITCSYSAPLLRTMKGVNFGNICRRSQYHV